MKKISLGIALAVAILPLSLRAAENDQNNSSQQGQSCELTQAEVDQYLVHAIHLADLAANALAIASFSHPAPLEAAYSPYQVLGNSGRIENVLYYMAGAYAVDLKDELPLALREKKVALYAAVDAFAGSAADESGAAFEKAFSAIEAFKIETVSFAQEQNASGALREFVVANLK